MEGMQVIQTWENFPFNNYGVISVYGDKLQRDWFCTIATDTNNILVNEASAQVTLTYGVNPLGDNLLQLTQPKAVLISLNLFTLMDIYLPLMSMLGYARNA